MGVVFSAPFLPLSRPPSVSPLSFRTLSNERRRVREVKVQQKDKPLFAGKQKPASEGFSPVFLNQESVMWDELPPFLVRLTAGMCSLIHFRGKVAAASGAVLLPRFLLGKRPGLACQSVV